MTSQYDLQINQTAACVLVWLYYFWQKVHNALLAMIYLFKVWIVTLEYLPAYPRAWKGFKVYKNHYQNESQWL